MDRLTMWNGNKYILPQGKGTFRQIAERLAAYENTGLSPEEINMFLRGEETTAKKRRVFISGPITDTEDYMERFAEAEKELLEEGFLPINPTRFSHHLIDADFSWDEFMDITMALLKQCSRIYMLAGWKNSRGASAEFRYAATHQYEIRMKEE